MALSKFSLQPPNFEAGQMSLNESAQWLVIIPTVIAASWSLYLHFCKKARMLIKVAIRQYDHAKRFDTPLHPVNALHLSFVNTSNHPLTISEIRFTYRNKSEQAKFVYDNLSHEKRSQLIGITLLKSQEIGFSLSYLDPDEQLMIDNLEDVALISTYGHEYKLGEKKLNQAIMQVKKLPLT